MSCTHANPCSDRDPSTCENTMCPAHENQCRHTRTVKEKSGTGTYRCERGAGHKGWHAAYKYSWQDCQSDKPIPE